MPAYFDEHKKTWYCKFRYNDWTGKSRFTTKRGFKTKREAKAYEAEFKSKQQCSPDMTVNSLCEMYLEQYKSRHKETSYVNTRYIITNYLVALLGSTSLRDLTKKKLVQWQGHILSLPVSESTKKSINAKAKAMLSFAVKMDIIEANPLISIPGIGAYSKRDGYWTHEQYRKFIEAGKTAKTKRYRLIALCFDILYYSGMRLGEFMGLTMESLDFDKNTITISRAINHLEKPSSLKNQQSYRTISMPPSIMERIKEYVDSLYDVPEKLFPVSRRCMRHCLEVWAEKAGLPPLVIHELRHSHVSYLISKGVPITAISKRIGHNSPKITLDVYSHLYGEKDTIADILQLEIDSVGQGVVKTQNES